MKTRHVILWTVLFLAAAAPAWVQEHVDCLKCHTSGRPDVPEGRHDHAMHAKAQITCATCHGQDDFDASGRHMFKEGFKPGRWEKAHFPTFCGTCHVQIKDDFERGPHGDATRGAKKLKTMAEGMRGCIDCHDFRRDAPLVFDDPPRHRNLRDYCMTCHDAGSTGATVGGSLADLFERKDSRLRDVRTAVDGVGRIPGIDVRMDRAALEHIHASFRRMKSVQHSMIVKDILSGMRSMDDPMAVVEASLQKKKSSVGNRVWWLLGFLGILLMNGVVITVRIRRIMKSKNGSRS